MRHTYMNIGRITLATIAGFGLGALAMYMFDPEVGKRRRALARDKAVGLAHDATDAVQSKARDLRNRAQGLAHEAGSAASKVMQSTGLERIAEPRHTDQTPGAGAA